MGVPSERGKASAIVTDGRMRGLPGYGVQSGKFLDSFPFPFFRRLHDLSDGAPSNIVELGALGMKAEIVRLVAIVSTTLDADATVTIGHWDVLDAYGTVVIPNGTAAGAIHEVDLSGFTLTDVAAGEIVVADPDGNPTNGTVSWLLILAPRLG